MFVAVLLGELPYLSGEASKEIDRKMQIFFQK